MKINLKVILVAIIFTFGASWIVAQTQLPNTKRSGSSGSAGTTVQGPPYDGGVRGPNSAMGTPDTTAVDKESSGAITRKKPVGKIRLDVDPGLTPTPSPSPSLTPTSL